MIVISDPLATAPAVPSTAFHDAYISQSRPLKSIEDFSNGRWRWIWRICFRVQGWTGKKQPLPGTRQPITFLDTIRVSGTLYFLWEGDQPNLYLIESVWHRLTTKLGQGLSNMLTFTPPTSSNHSMEQLDRSNDDQCASFLHLFLGNHQCLPWRSRSTVRRVRVRHTDTFLASVHARLRRVHRCGIHVSPDAVQMFNPDHTRTKM